MRSMLGNFPMRRSAESSAMGRVIGFSCIADLSPAGSPATARKPPPDEHLSDRGFAALRFPEPRAGRRRELQIFALFQAGFQAPQQASPTRSSYPPHSSLTATAPAAFRPIRGRAQQHLRDPKWGPLRGVAPPWPP